MADVRAFRGLRFDPAVDDPALTIAPPYDVISPAEQRALYERSPHNVVRIEYGEQFAGDTASDNRYSRAARDMDAWKSSGVLVRDAMPVIYSYQLEFAWAGRRHTRSHYVVTVRLEEWDKGIIKPHEHTLSGPKADRLDLLRATGTQISPVYCLYRAKSARSQALEITGVPLYDFEADGQRHRLSAITVAADIERIAAHLLDCDLYIADGHHRYETALKYRDECRAAAASWTGDEPENFVLMALTDAADPGLLVLPTHRLLTVPAIPADALARIAMSFRVEPVASGGDLDAGALARLEQAQPSTAFLALGLVPGTTHLLTLEDRAAIERLMPADRPQAWKRLDVSVLQYGILNHVFGIDDAALAAGGAVSYTQDPRAAQDAVATGRAKAAFLLNATPVEQVLAVADAGGRMPQKSTYFYPKLPTGLVMNPLQSD